MMMFHFEVSLLTLILLSRWFSYWWDWKSSIVITTVYILNCPILLNSVCFMKLHILIFDTYIFIIVITWCIFLFIHMLIFLKFSIHAYAHIFLIILDWNLPDDGGFSSTCCQYHGLIKKLPWPHRVELM